MSDDDLLTTGNVARHNITAAVVEMEFKIPISVNAPVPIPAGNEAEYVIWFIDIDVADRSTRASSSLSAVSDTFGAKVLFPTAMCYILAGVPPVPMALDAK